jgi:hypothetical protein
MVNCMDIGNMVGDAFAYAKDAVLGKWMQWLLLVIATILLCIPLMGYSIKVLRGEKPAPEVTGWGTLFVDGIKYFIVSIIWALPCLIILFFAMASFIFALISGNTEQAMQLLGGALIGLLIFVIVAIITGLLATIGIIRFARTGSMSEAFNFGEILATIGKIGWGTYILAMIVLIIVQIVFSIVIGIVMMIPVLGLIIELVLIAPITLFEARYLSLLYDNAGAA